MPAHPIIIGLTGPINSGKDTVAKFLDQDYDFVHLRLADTLKAMLDVLLYDLTGDADVHKHWEDQKWKRTTIPELNVTPRYLAQTLGTEWGREAVHDRIWLRCLEARIKRIQRVQKRAHFVISDVRFPNEALWVAERGLLIGVARPKAGDTDAEWHPSENGIAPYEPTIVIKNTGTLEDLRRAVHDTMVTLFPGTNPISEEPRQRELNL